MDDNDQSFFIQLFFFRKCNVNQNTAFRRVGARLFLSYI